MILHFKLNCIVNWPGNIFDSINIFHSKTWKKLSVYYFLDKTVKHNKIKSLSKMFCSLVNGKCFCYVEIPNASVQARHRSKIFYLLSYYSSSIRSQRSWQCVHSLLKIKHCLAVKPHKLSEQSVQKKKIKKKIKYRHVFVFLICLNACVSILNIRQARKQTKN